MLQRRHAGEIEITDDDVLCVEIAGLCHDLGIILLLCSRGFHAVIILK